MTYKAHRIDNGMYMVIGMAQGEGDPKMLNIELDLVCICFDKRKAELIADHFGEYPAKEQ